MLFKLILEIQGISLRFLPYKKHLSSPLQIKDLFLSHFIDIQSVLLLVHLLQTKLPPRNSGHVYMKLTCGG